jgi:tetratricopeptide (TPR) repeat protein
MAAVAPAQTGRLIGRVQPLGALDRLVARAVAGAGGMAVILGDAGAGKTRLLAEAAERARAAGATVAWGTAWEGEGVPALWPWMQVLRACGEAAAVEGGIPATPVASVESSRFPVFLAVMDALDRAAASEPLLLVLDDVHWADPDSLALVTFVARQVPSRPIAVMVAARADELSRAAADELAGAGEVIALGPLAVAEVAALVEDTTGLVLEVGDATVLHERTAGNPLFVRETAHLLAASAPSAVAAVGLPVGVRAVITRRLARVAQPTMAVLQAASVLGATGAVADIAELAGCSVAEVRDLLAPALAAALVEHEPGPTESVRFAHAVIRDVVYDEASAAVRLALHGRAASMLEGRSHDPDRWSAVAAHRTRSGAAPADIALASARAASRATEVLAFNDASHHLERALEASRAAGAAPDEIDEVALQLGDARLRAGDLAGARAAFLEVAERAGRDGRGRDMARAALGLGAGLVGFEVPIHDPNQVHLLQRALDAVGTSDLGLRSALLGRLAVAAFRSPEAGSAVELASEAVALARETGDDVALAVGLSALCDAIPAPSHAVERLAHAGEVVAIGAVHDAGLELLGRRLRLRALLELGDLRAAAAEVTAYEHVAARLRQPLYSWYVPLWRAMFAVCRGSFDEAVALTSEAHDIGAMAGSDNARMLSVTVLASVAMFRGEAPPVPLLEDYGELVTEWSALAAAAAWHALAGGDLDEAARLYRSFAADGFDRIDHDAERLVTCMAFAEVAIALRDHTGLQRLHDLLEPDADLCLVDGIGGAWFGPARLVLARIDHALGRTEEARRHADAAVAFLAGRGAPWIELLAANLRDTVGGSPATQADRSGATAGVCFRLDGDVWHLTWGGDEARLRDAKGLRDLAVLLARPGEMVHVSELAGGGIGDAGPRIDRPALAAYRQRLAEIDDDLADADAASDLVRSERLAVERDHLLAELSGALGIGGRPRVAGSDAERARKAVTGRVKQAIDRIEGRLPALGRHLRNSVRTGTWCTYVPEQPVPWQLSGGSGIARRDLAPPG